MAKLTVRDVDVRGKRVLVRVDFNVPLDKKTGAITDDTRIKASLPTLRYLTERGARVVLGSHLGRPDGRVQPELRLRPVAERLAQLLGSPVGQSQDCIGPKTEKLVAELPPGGVLLLENLRFHPEEEANDPAFAQALARLADIYVDDAFGTAHRAHASTAGVASHLPAVAGLLMEKELEFLGRALAAPARPFAALLGGAKVSSKIGVLENLLRKVDRLLIGGGMAATFLKAQGLEVGLSLVEDDRLSFARRLAAQAQEKKVTLVLPRDVVVAREMTDSSPQRTVPVDQVPTGWRILDIGPGTVRDFQEHLRGCRTVLWNGPLGVYELAPFAEGTRAVARFLAGLDGATTIAGGGETVAALEEMGLTSKITHVSTGGGATLEFLEGKTLPGVAVLRDREG